MARKIMVKASLIAQMKLVTLVIVLIQFSFLSESVQDNDEEEE